MATWREFEALVARIEEALAPKGALVKSPDRVRDLVSKRLREVDASIRFDVGSTPILITIECRDRRGVQDDTWIEQLATKKQKIGAAKTIAVSATGFSDSASKTAELFGIELRHLTDRIEEEIVQEFLSGIKVSLIVTEWSTRTVGFELEDGTWLDVERFGDDLVAMLRGEGESEALCSAAGTGHIVTVNSILRQIPNSDLPKDGETTVVKVEASYPPGVMLVSTKDGPVPLRRIALVAQFGRRTVPAPATSLYEYAAPNRAIRHTLEAVGQLSDEEGVKVQVDVFSPVLDTRTPSSDSTLTAKSPAHLKDLPKAKKPS